MGTQKENETMKRRKKNTSTHFHASIELYRLNRTAVVLIRVSECVCQHRESEIEKKRILN